jgi:osmotically inducible lipoprotein OsmB
LRDAEIVIQQSIAKRAGAIAGFPAAFAARYARRRITMSFASISRLCAVSLLAISAAGCSSWDSMSHRQKSTVTGAGIGGVTGAVITNGGVLGTVGGAAVGGVIGNQVGK